MVIGFHVCGIGFRVNGYRFSCMLYDSVYVIGFRVRYMVPCMCYRFLCIWFNFSITMDALVVLTSYPLN